MEPFSIGVDLGGTNLRVAAYVGGEDFLEVIQLPTRLSEGPDIVVRDMCEAIHSVRQRVAYGRTLTGIAVGAPGPLELPDGILRNPPNLDGWDGFNLRQAIESILGCPIKLDNDANMAALAELKIGAGRTHSIDSICVLTLGTGVGSGIVLDGAIRSGSTGMGGEAGHIVVETNGGVLCGCGGAGCLEQYASATAIVRMAREIMGTTAPATASALAARANDGHTEASYVFAEVGRYLAIALTGLINTLNLPLYILGGGVSEAWALFAPAMFKELHRRSYIYRLTQPDELEPSQLERHKTYIQRAKLGASSGLLGSCLLASSGTDG